MRIHLLAVGQRLPTWVNQGYQEYAQRLPRDCELKLVEISPLQRPKNADLPRIIQREGERLLAALPRDAHVIALDETGHPWDTATLSQQLALWRQQGRDIALLVGGPDGLSSACKARAEGLWSLSPLTLPHPLVRVVVAEALYRAWSLIHNHPYHRA